ncbi:MAG: hypothetical protein KDC05_08195 [Bacteroidales bacterium]|nr:hypothetical protein [Bacteroidales bacterium]
MQLLRTILIIILVYYAVRLFFRYVVPILARYFIRKTVENQQNERQKRHREGDMHIRYKPDKKDIPDDLGEFVDYEEIKDPDPEKKEKKKDNT